jgi:CubicO group peptidase (beta-lactamase class C family)
VRHDVLADQRIRTAVDSVLDKAIDEQRIVGAVVLVSLSGHLVYERATGYADREARRPTRPDTIFRWSSLTKAVVAAATLALVEKGAVAFNDPVTRFLQGLGCGAVSMEAHGSSIQRKSCLSQP